MIIISIILAKINVMKITFIKINDGYIKKYIIVIFIHKKRKMKAYDRFGHKLFLCFQNRLLKNNA